MAYIDLGNDLPGIRGPMAYRPETSGPLNELAEVLLRNDDNTLTRGERELIGAYVSHLNDCFFCHNVHAALAQYYMECDSAFLKKINDNFQLADLTPKMKALLAIAAAVQKSGRAVTEQHIVAARTAGATDPEIHDAVLIAAAFCMFNRYVDGLGTWAPQDPQVYMDRAPLRAKEGYANLNPHK